MDADGRSDLPLADWGENDLPTISGDSDSSFSVGGFDGPGALIGDAGGGYEENHNSLTDVTNKRIGILTTFIVVVPLASTVIVIPCGT